ncbi:MAG: glycosyltransferase [Actinomycetota bacterium]
MDVSVITTLYNERGSVEELLGSLFSQTLAPAEIVVADGGSTDGTRGILAELARRHPTLRVVDCPGGRSAGRNAAISTASHELIACIDGGCVAEPDWLEKLSAPFAEGADWVAGFYRPEGRSLLSTCLGLVMVYVREEVDEGFLPSGRSMAFRRKLWQEVGGFPEELDFAEDTLFGERLRAAGHLAHFTPEAVVRWRPPPGFRTLARTLYRWGHGDGVAGLRGFAYKRLALLFGATGLGVVVALARGRWALPVVLAPLAAWLARGTRPKYAWARGLLKFLYLPLAQLVHGLAGTAGWVAGTVERRRR